MCCLREVKQACITTSRRLPYREKDESHIVISIDFKADLIDLFEGNKKTATKLRGSKFDKGIPKQSNVETFNHFLRKSLS